MAPRRELRVSIEPSGRCDDCGGVPHGLGVQFTGHTLEVLVWRWVLVVELVTWVGHEGGGGGKPLPDGSCAVPSLFGQGPEQPPTVH